MGCVWADDGGLERGAVARAEVERVPCFYCLLDVQVAVGAFGAGGAGDGGREVDAVLRGGGEAAVDEDEGVGCFGEEGGERRRGDACVDGVVGQRFFQRV